MKRVNNSKKKHDNDDDYDDPDNNAPLIINDDPREARLDDIMYGYGGEEAIHRSGPDTPVDVLHAYKELCLLRRCGDIINSIVSFIDNDNEYDNVTIHSINN